MVPASLSPPPTPASDTSAGVSGPPSINRIVNLALADRDCCRYRRDARWADRSPLTLAALGTPASRSMQPYMHRRDASALLLYRSGYLPQDSQLALDDLMSSKKRGVHVPAPAFLTCPDCHAAVNDEDGSSGTSCQFKIMMHRFSCCPARSAILTWYHDVAVRSVPTPEMAALLARARSASSEATPSPQAQQDIQAFLRHLLEPSALCRPADDACQRRLTHAVTLLLTYKNADAPRLPPPEEFGPSPCIQFPACREPVRPLADHINDAFWALVLVSAHSVLRPRADEAEAPRGVRHARVRECRKRGRHDDR